MRQAWAEYAEDGIEDKDAKWPPWLHLLKQCQAEGFVLKSESGVGVAFSIPLEDILLVCPDCRRNRRGVGS